MVAGFIMLLSGCVERMFYFPDSEVYGLPTDEGMGFEDVVFSSGDGTELSGWFVPAQREEALGTVVQFHGNAQNMTSHFDFVGWLVKEGFNVFVFDYRGYGRSEGKPKKEGLYQDSVAAMEYVFGRGDVDGNKVVVLGQSLGGNQAIAACAKFSKVKAIAIESTFSSYQAVVEDKVGAMPVLGWGKGWLSRRAIDNDYSASEYIGQIHCPVVFVHGTDDKVVESYHSERLYEMANEPKELWLIEDGGHTCAFLDREYQKKLVEFYLEKLAEKGEE
ncbi:MAG: alpha/beta hydrolase [Phycisphaerae bacterium]|nr:alpha/beta hydrolase [Phycisphaerae bacterium]